MTHLFKVMREGGVHVGYSHAASINDHLCFVVRTDHNERAEQVLKDYLILADEEKTT